MTLRRYFGLLVGLALLVALFFVVDIRRIGAALAGANWALALCLPLLFLFNYLVQTLRFRAILDHFGLRPPFAKTYQVVLSGVVVNTIAPGGGGDILTRPYLVRHLFGIPAKTTFTATVTERLFDLVFLLLNGLLAATLIFPGLLVTLGLVLLALIIGALAFLHFPLERLPLPKAVKKLWTDFRVIKTVPQRVLAVAALYTLASWLVTITIFLVAGLALHQPPSTTLVAIFILSFVVGLLSLIPAGLGTNELSMSALLHLHGYPASLGVSLLLLVRVFNVAPCALLSLPLLRDLARHPWSSRQ